MYQFRMEPPEREALELERTKGKPWAELSAELTRLKQTELWLYDFDAQMRQQALADLRRAYINFFERRVK